MDSNDFYIDEKSALNLPFNEVFFKLKLKYDSFLGHPFEPDCHIMDTSNSSRRYNQYNCFLNCFNRILFDIFHCKLINSAEDENNFENHFCHPLFLPLIENFVKIRWTNWKTFSGEECLKPCNAYYYEIESKKYYERAR